MDKSTTTPQERHFSAQASLAGLGVLRRQRDVFAPIRARVRIAQKTVRHAPLDKRYDGFIHDHEGSTRGGGDQYAAAQRAGAATGGRRSAAGPAPRNRRCSRRWTPAPRRR